MYKQYCCWITLNRKCNLRCKWCYARETNYSNQKNLEKSVFNKLLEIIKSYNLNHVTLIGGEPTLYPDLNYIIKKAQEKEISCGIVTNGLKFANIEYTKQLKEIGLASIGLSLKGYSETNYFDVTGTNEYYNCLNAIQNIRKVNIPFAVSMVLSSDNINSFLLGVKDALNYGANNFSFSFEFDYIQNKKFNKIDFINLFKLIDGFYNQYDRLCELTNNVFSLHQILPLCIWDNDMLVKMQKKQQIYTSCQLLQRNGLIFDTNGDLLVCNALYKYPIAKYGTDFYEAIDLKNYLNGEIANNVYNELCHAPSTKCRYCELWQICGGGCISNWLHYSLEELLHSYELYKSHSVVKPNYH